MILSSRRKVEVLELLRELLLVLFLVLLLSVPVFRDQLEPCQPRESAQLGWHPLEVGCVHGERLKVLQRRNLGGKAARLPGVLELEVG